MAYLGLVPSEHSSGAAARLMHSCGVGAIPPSSKLILGCRTPVTISRAFGERPSDFRFRQEAFWGVMGGMSIFAEPSRSPGTGSKPPRFHLPNCPEAP
jgi:hypothetical protein